MQSIHPNPTMHRPSFLPWILLLVVIIGGGGYVFRDQVSNWLGLGARTSLSGEGTLKRIQDLHNLEAVAYHLEVVIPKENEAKAWWKVGLDNQKALFIANGKVIAGIDLGQLTERDVEVSEDGTLIRIMLPSAVILDVNLTKIQTYSTETGLFGLIHLDEGLRQEAQSDARIRLQEIACESNILQVATENSQRDVERLFSLIDGVEVVVETQPAATCMN